MGAAVVRRFGNEYEQELFRDIENQQASFLISKNSGKIETKKEEIRDLVSQIWWRTPELQMQLFQQLSSSVSFAGYNDPNRARHLEFMMLIQRTVSAVARRSGGGFYEKES